MRKQRLNDLNRRIGGLSQKILALDKVDSAMRIMSPAHFPILPTHHDPKHNPHASIFFDD